MGFAEFCRILQIFAAVSEVCKKHTDQLRNQNGDKLREKLHDHEMFGGEESELLVVQSF